MSKPVITVENLSKAYRIGLKEEVPDTLMSAMTGFLRAPLKKFNNLRRLNTFGHSDADDQDIYWALKDVSFEVQEGEVLGIIGRNGAGKSTLLKILSRITEPTRGRAVIRGRVSSLLEVGTGFHPELSGRENVYLNGTILGMTKREIDRKFDEIVEFSGVEKFLDTPVKRYSSGMRVRLAFSVAAFLESSVLFIDEVLAVGDSDFQRRCLGRMQTLASSGRTVLFVSHNLGVLRAYCTSGVVLEQGRVTYTGGIDQSLKIYLDQIRSMSTVSISERTDRRGKGRIRLEAIEVNAGSPDADCLQMGGPAQFRFKLSQKVAGVDFSVTIFDSTGAPLSNVDTWRKGPGDSIATESSEVLICEIPELPLRPGRYYLNSQITLQREMQDAVDFAAWFEVADGVYRGRVYPYASVPGPICIDHQWRSAISQGEAL